MKNLRKPIVALLLLALFVGMTGIGLSLTPPPPPPPPVPQNLGLFDTSIAFLHTNATDQSTCRQCHQTSGTNISGGYSNTIGGVPTRHHNLLPEQIKNPLTNVPFACQDCHPSTPGVGNGILLDRSCTDCHNATNFWGNSIGGHVGNLSRPHHFNTTYDDANIGNPVQDRQCKTCHGSFVDNYNDSHYKPTYDTSFMITPWATFRATNFSQPLPQLFHSDGTLLENKTWGGCESCHLGTVNASGNNSLAAKGLFTGTPILDNHDSHHQTILDGFVNVSGNYQTLGGRTPGATCSWCHVLYPGEIIGNTTNPFTFEILTGGLELRNSTIEAIEVANGRLEPGTVNITINGTGCEKCHSVKTIHNIQAGYVPNGTGPQGMGHINNNLDCYGCHNSWLPADTWVPGALVPYLNSVSPSVIVANTATTLTVTGSNFVNDPYTSVVSIDGVQYTPTSITDSQIVVNIPALTAGVHVLQLVKGGDSLSKPTTLTVVSNAHVDSAKLKAGTLTITGTNLGSMPAANAKMYVSAKHGANQITSNSITSWTATKIVAKVPNSVVINDVATVLTTNAGETTATIVKG